MRNPRPYRVRRAHARRAREAWQWAGIAALAIVALPLASTLAWCLGDALAH